MKYNASFTKGINMTIVVIILYLLIVNFIGGSSINDLIFISFPVIIFGIFYIFALTKGTYIVVESGRIRNYLMFFPKGAAEINKIINIRLGSLSGIFKALKLVYNENGKEKDMNISILNFKKDTLKKFLSDLKKQNQQITIDSSVQEFIQ